MSMGTNDTMKMRKKEGKKGESFTNTQDLFLTYETSSSTIIWELEGSNKELPSH
jgi:hypothetical protein